MKASEDEMRSELKNITDIYGEDLLSAPRWAFNQINILSTKIVAIQNRKKLGDQLKSWREKRGLTFQEVAKQAGMHPDQIKKVELGEEGYTVDSLLCILDVLALNLALKVSQEIGKSES